MVVCGYEKDTVYYVWILRENTMWKLCIVVIYTRNGNLIIEQIL